MSLSILAAVFPKIISGRASTPKIPHHIMIAATVAAHSMYCLSVVLIDRTEHDAAVSKRIIISAGFMTNASKEKMRQHVFYFEMALKMKPMCAISFIFIEYLT